MEKFCKAKSVFVIGIISLSLPFFVNAAIATNTIDNFFIEQNHDVSNREKITARVETISDRAYFYIETEWWDTLTTVQRNDMSDKIFKLADKFDDEIYPVMTETYGDEWKPGIDSDYKITILIHDTKDGIAGYFREKDEASRIKTSDSNEREMVYLSRKVLDTVYPEAYLAHEFMHLITYNQKNRVNLIKDDVWLNEMRAEYASTLLGYDDEYLGTNIQNRIRIFIEDSNNSLIKWDGGISDYGALNLFGQYLVDQFGIDILTQSLWSKKTGLDSLDYVLNKLGVNKTIEEVFIDWQIAISANDCSLGEGYCYKNEPLASIGPFNTLIYLTGTQKAHYNLTYSIEQWSGNWYKVLGGDKGIKIEFISDEDFKVPYFVTQNNSVQYLKYLEIKDGKGIIEMPYFGQDNKTITLVPNVIGEYTGENYTFSLNISTFEPEENLDTLLAQIAELQAQIQALLLKIQQLKGDSCSSINNNLYIGLINNQGVKCLQQLLVDEGVYPEAIVNGNFFLLTKNAVIKFQNKYKSEILTPVGLFQGSGYVGPMTRAKVNDLLVK